MKILIVDDSALIRGILKQFLTREHDFLIVGETSNGRSAVELSLSLEPDLVIMDINMPIMDGLEATRRIMKEKPVPILIFSSELDAHRSFEVLNSGAVDVMRKPDIGQLNEPAFCKEFLEKIRLVARARPWNRISTFSEKSAHREECKVYKIVVMGASTGGPFAVRTILQGLAETFPVGIVLVQHLEEGFDEGYAKWLNEATELSVRLASVTDSIQPGKVLVAPVNRHLIVRNGFLIQNNGPKVLNQKPSIDVLFESAAECFGEQVIGVLLTGMGRDGARGCAKIVSRGGLTVVQDEKTSTIFGMPKAAIESGGASKILPLQDIPQYLTELVKT